ncbi:rRNA maturation RNase YbeY [Clostridium fermenticellae]|uniref:Endoribonuclease YbeY n=1 Tax=Clostridium fermenticellae TaxID=2068654 RepID=A0A386H632_9CLOT|nr:rRNA maturation RNase YbeY [Clostridium fermenticellae]AYD40975.1 rRNA maturation RNase YbeY [Clostridium fermenticellae]
MIFIDNRQNKIEVADKLKGYMKDIIEYALKAEGVKVPCEVSVLFVDNESIREINKENRDIDSATDVLSFPMLDYGTSNIFKDVYNDNQFEASDLDDGNLILGDIVISLEKAKEQSIEFDHTFEREVLYLTVHSVLHLLGYDHMEKNEKIIMRKREEEILEEFKIIR